MSASLELYRDMFPEHNAVSDTFIDTWLALAAQAHTASAWGAIYSAAMCAWAAAHVHPLFVEGVVGNTAEDCGNPPAAVVLPNGGATPAKVVVPDVENTRGWRLYLRYRQATAAAFPLWVSQCL